MTAPVHAARPRAAAKRRRQPRHGSGGGARPGRLAGGIITVLLVVIGVPAAFFAWDIWQAKGAADSLKASIGPAQEAASARDAAQVTALLTGVSADMRVFADHTDGPLWDFAAAVPWVQDQVTPLMVAGGAIGELQASVVEPLTQQDLSLIESPPILNGRIDPYVAEPFVPILADAERIITAQQPRLDAVELDNTVGVVASGFATLRDAMVDMLPGLETANEVLPMVPQLLAAGTERSYLVMIANNAEPRARGGLYGAQLEVTVADGAIVLGDYFAADYATGDYPRGEFLETTEEELAVFGPSPLTFNFQDMAFTPEFPRTAEIASRFWVEAGRAPLSGIITIDPVAMQYVLGDMEPITVEGLTVTSDTVADALLGDIYIAIPDPLQQDAVFSAVASSIFTEIMAGNIDFGGVADAFSERRVLAWSPDAGEEEVFSALAIDGSFLADPDTVGVFLNDRSGSKIGYYLDTYASVVASECVGDRAQRLDLSYTATLALEGDVNALPWYVSGGKYDVPKGHYAGWVQVYLPGGAQVTEVVQYGESVPFEVLPHEGRSVLKLWIDLVPQQSTVIKVAMTGDFSPELDFVTTPTADSGTYSALADLGAMRCPAVG